MTGADSYTVTLSPPLQFLQTDLRAFCDLAYATAMDALGLCHDPQVGTREVSPTERL